MITQLYIAVSVDGMVADRAGNVGFLDGHDPAAYGYEAFFASVDAMVMGRRTYEQTLSFGAWPYGEKAAYVMTSRPLPSGPASAWSGSAGDLSARLRSQGCRRVWHVGGPATARDWARGGLIDVVDLFVIPTILGDGIRLFDGWEGVGLRLEGMREFAGGVVRLTYRTDAQKKAPSR